MRISSQNNQFIFNLPQDLLTVELDKQFQLLIEKNYIPYQNVIDYINSTIKDIVFPSLSYGTTEQHIYHGKKILYREAGNVMDKFGGELDITFRSVDSNLNYFILLQILNNFYLNKKTHIDILYFKILDKDGDVLYTVVFKEVIFKSLSELRLSYNASEFSERTFTVNFSYNFIDVIWELGEDYLDNSKSIFDLGLEEDDPYDYTKLEDAYKKRLRD